MHWRLDDNGLLTISGTGPMKNYTDSDPAEWAKYDVFNAVIESGVTKIGNNAFFCAGSKLKSVIIADAVVVIGDNAFKDCANLTEITFKGDVPGAIEGTAFSGVTATAYYPFEADSWTATERNKFGESFTWKAYDSQGKVFYAAGNCSTDLKWALSTEGVLTIAGTGTMDESPWREFSSSIFSVVIDSGVKSIGVSAFDSCSGLTSVSIPDSVTIIEKSAFNGCSKLESVSIPDTVTSIGDRAFADFDSSSEIIFKGSAPTFGDEVFYLTTATAYYPASNSTWTDGVRKDYGGTITWIKASCVIKFDPSADMSEGSSVWVDGIEYKLISEGGKLCVKLSNEKAKVVTVYTYNGGGTAHETYPTGMKVWLLSHYGKEYTANYVSDFDNLLSTPAALSEFPALRASE